MRLAMLLALLPCAAMGQNCGPDDAVVSTLASKYGVSVQMTGLSASGSMIRLLGSPDTGTWTVIETTPNKVSCLRAMGNHMQFQPAPAAAMGDDS